MSYEYAVRKLTRNDKFPEKTGVEEYTRNWNSMGHFFYDVEYVPVNQEIAEIEPMGLRRLLDMNGQPASGWSQMKKKEATEKKLQTINSKKLGDPLKDSRGYELAAGDYVYGGVSKASGVFLFKVLSFADKKVRLVAFPPLGADSYDSLETNDPAYVVKVNGLIEDPDYIMEKYGYPKVQN